MKISKETINDLYDRINQIQEGSIIELTRDNRIEIETLIYTCKYDEDFCEYDLLNEDNSECWGCGSATLGKMKLNLLIDGMEQKYEKIKIS